VNFSPTFLAVEVAVSRTFGVMGQSKLLGTDRGEIFAEDRWVCCSRPRQWPEPLAGGVEMSSPDLHEVTGDIWVTVRAVPGLRDLRPSVDDVMPLAPVDQDGEIARSFLRRQPVRIVAGRIEGGYTSAFEVICCDCGDNPFLGYSEVSPRLQRLRGPYTVREGFAAYEKHLAARRATHRPKKDLPNRRRS